MLEMQRSLYVVRRWWWLLIAAAIVGGVVAYGLTKALVKQQYQATAMIAMAPPPTGLGGPYVNMLAPSADAQLIPTVATAHAAVRSLPANLRAGVDPVALAGALTASASPDNEVLSITTKWGDPAMAMQLTNAVARSFIAQERVRLKQRYAIIHGSFLAQENHFAGLIGATTGGGAARSWLQSQYADSASRIYQLDADAHVQALTQESSLQLAQPAATAGTLGPRAKVNAVLGAALAFLLALLVAFAATTSYGESRADEALPTVLSKVGD